MAFIGTLRNKMGTWVVIFVFVAITAFILGDIFSGNSNILNWGRNSVGEIAGKEITIDEYQAAIQEREQNYMLNTGREPGEREMPGIRQQAWDMLIARYAIQPQFSKVGVEVTDEELVDMIEGVNIEPGIKQSFINPQTGEFDRAQLAQYIGQLKQLPAGSPYRQRWEVFQRDLRPGRERIKYENLLIKSIYATKAEAEREYHVQNDVSEVKYLYVPYYAISDSAAQVTDADLEAYYNKHKENFKTEASRNIKYVSFPVIATADDSLAIREELTRLVAELRTTDEDSAFAAANSDRPGAYGKYNPATVPAFVPKDSLAKGKVFGPFLDGDTYKLVKVSDAFRDTAYTARARHILIKWNDESDVAKAEAKKRAQDILKEVKGGADFAMQARQFSADPGSAQRGGDLGWFSSGQMVKPFQNAIFNATRTGIVNDIVETQFGYHIIDVTDLKTNEAYQIAVIEREITPSDATVNEAFRKAESFAADISNTKEFEAKAKAEGLTVLEGNNILAGDRRIGTLGEARQVVQWLFRDASIDEVSQVFDLQEQNVVAVMTGEVEKGYRPLKLVKEQITPAVRNEVKGRIISERLGKLNGTLEELAKTFGTDANVYSASDLRLSANSMQSVGFDPQVVGTAFSLENGKRSKPVIGENGVTILELQNKTVAPALEDYSTYRTQIEQNNQNRNAMGISEAIKENADIEDKRYKFY